MQDLCNLLFELSNVDRLNILIELKKKPMKLSHVSKRFGFTVPETARNISRLQEANLIAKDVNGVFHLTPIGEEALHLIPAFKFLSKHKKYFMTHTLNTLPPEFITGIGALANCKFVNEVTDTTKAPAHKTSPNSTSHDNSLVLPALNKGGIVKNHTRVHHSMFVRKETLPI